MRRARTTGYMAVARAIADTDARPWLGGPGPAALVLCGEDDQVTGMACRAPCAAGLPHARLRSIAGAGHAPHVEQPDRFAEIVREFLRPPDGPPSAPAGAA